MVRGYRIGPIRKPGRLVEGGEWLLVSGGDLPWPIAIRVGFDEDGRFACTGLVAGFTNARTVELSPSHRIVDIEDHEVPITSRELRSVRISEILDAAADGPEIRALLGPRPTRVKRPASSMPGRRGHDPSFYEGFAAAYEAQARQSRRSPVPALAKKYDKSEAAIYRWINRARDLGFLGEEELT